MTGNRPRDIELEKGRNGGETPLKGVLRSQVGRLRLRTFLV